MFTVKINDKSLKLDLNQDLNTGDIDGESFEIDLLKSENGYHVIRKGKSYHVELIEVNRKAKEVELRINGHLIKSKVEDKFDVLLKSLGMEAGVSKKITELVAPMPGMVLEIEVKTGDEVKVNDPVLILEAMKMENIIKSPTDGKIKNISVEVGKTVEKNAVLIEFE